MGLGIINQKTGKYEESIRIFLQGLDFFPESEMLNMCTGISYMNMEQYSTALEYFLKFKESDQAHYYISNCYRALGLNKE